MNLPDPTDPVDGNAELFLRYLDYFRATLLAKTGELSPAEQQSSRLPSGWTPLQLVKHLRFVELRWIEWGFEGRPIDEPWGDHRDERWYVAPDETFDDLAAGLRAQGEHTRDAVRKWPLDAVGEPGPRWRGNPPATLERVLFHLLQEYARHVGHLDVVAELAGGSPGE